MQLSQERERNYLPLSDGECFSRILITKSRVLPKPLETKESGTSGQGNTIKKLISQFVFPNFYVQGFRAVRLWNQLLLVLRTVGCTNYLLGFKVIECLCLNM